MTEISATEGIMSGGSSRMSVVLQNEAAECGLACLAMISSAFGKRVSLIELRRRFSISAKGVNLKGLMDMADVLGLVSRPVRLEINDVRELKLPAILHWDMKHFVVLASAKRSKFLIYDPACGRRWIDRGEMNRSFTGVALEFTPSSSFERRKTAERAQLGDLFVHVRGLVPSLIQMFVLAAIMQLFSLLSPILNQLVIDEAITKGDLGLLSILAGGMVLLLATTTAVKMLQGFVGLYLGTQLSFQMQTNLLRHALRLPVGWFEKRHVGDIMSRFGSLSPVKDFLLGAITSSILNLLVGMLSLVMMLIYSPMLAGVEVASVLIFAGVQTVTFPYFRRKTDENLHLEAKVQTTFLETIRGARTFKLFGQERERVAIWQNEQANLINNQIQLAKFGLLGGAGTGLLMGVQQIAVWFLGARMVINGELTLGMLFAFQAYTAQFGGASSGLIGQIFSYRTLRLHLERIGDIVYSDQEKGIDVPVDPNRACRGQMSMKNVSFRYADHEPWVLRDVNLDVAPGEFVCLQGPSGQGKTTILKLLLGFHDPLEGEILFEGVPLRSFGIRTFRSHVGVVLQDDQLFAGTIADNISFFDYTADVEDIETAGKAAQIHDEIMCLPMGYYTLCGDLGSTLSAGQRQRVLLARALYRAPSILLLDEGTANLDPASEHKVMEIIADLKITRIVVAHREGASLGADRFINVAGGQAVESR